MSSKRGVVLVCCLAVLLSSAAMAATLEVGPGKPYASIQAAVTAANAGDTVSVTGGPYTEAVQVNNLGHARDGITIQGPGVTLNGGFGIQTSNGKGADRVTIDGFTIIGGASSGSIKNAVRVSASGVTIRNCTMQGVVGSQCWAIETTGGSNNLRIEGNTITGNQAGIYLNPSTGITIRGNVIADNNGDGSAASGKIALGTDTVSSLVVEGNTISGHDLEGMGAYQVGSHVIRNNNFVDNGSAITWYAGGDITATNNWWGSADGPADPLGTLEVPENPGASVAQMLNAVPAGTLGNPVCDGVNWAPVPGTNHISYYPFLGAATDPATYPPSPTALPMVVWVDDNWTGSTNCGGHVWGYDAFATIQNGVNGVATGGTVNVAAGTYAGGVVIGKSLTMAGAGSGETETVVSGGSQGLNVTASNVTLQALRVTGATHGVYTDSTIANLALDNVATVGNSSYGVGIHNNAAVTGLDMTDCLLTGNGVGMRVRGAVDGLQVSGCHFDNNSQGFNSTTANGESKPLKNVRFSSSTFNNNTLKGLYFEKLQDAVLTGLTVTGSGNGLANGVGLDVNLKYGAFSGITISNCTLTNCGTFDAAMGCGIAIKARDDGSYAVNAATLTNTSVSGCTLASGRKGIVVGEPTKGNAGPTDLAISGCTFVSNSEVDIYNYCRSGVVVTATGNTWTGGASTNQEIEARVTHDVDDAALGHVDWGQGAATATALAVSPASGSVGQTVQLMAKLTAGGNPLAGQPVNFTVAGAAAGSGTTDAAGVAVASYAITTGGDKAIAASFAGVSNYKAATGSNTLSVAAAAPTALTLTPNPTTVTSGAVVTYTAMGDNGVNYTSQCTFYTANAAGGSWAGSAYTTAKAGTWTVTAVYNTLTATAALTVNHGPATGLTLTPADATIIAGNSQAYVATATDAAGNSFSDGIALGENGAGSLAGSVYTSTAGDAGSDVTITATCGSQSATATLHVQSADGPGSVLAWDKDTRKFYLCSNPANPETGTEITGTGTFNGIAVVMSGTGTNLTVTVPATSSALRVQWYLRGVALYRVYEYSTIGAVSRTAQYNGTQTYVDGAWKAGFWGLTHTLSGSTATYGNAAQ